MKYPKTMLLVAALSFGSVSQAAIVLNAGTKYTQNFDSLRSSQTLPSDWQITFSERHTDPSYNPYLDSSSSLAYEAISGTPTLPGTYDFGKSSGADHAVGSIPDHTGPDGTRSSLLLVHFQINDPTISLLRITYNIETYRVNELPMGAILGLYSSSQTPTNRHALGGPLSAGSSIGYFFSNIPSKAVSVDLTSEHFSTGDLYLIYQFNGIGNSAVALDDFSITAIPEPGSAILLVAGIVTACRRHRRISRA